MCGIVGYIGNKQAAPILVDGLKKLEYRGYDSAGIAVSTTPYDEVRKHALSTQEVSLYDKKSHTSKTFEIIKTLGRLDNLQREVEKRTNLNGCVGIGHTRWATHGAATLENAHPHTSDDQLVVGVHNGIIENFRELKEELGARGYSFYSDTDTEVCIKLVHEMYETHNHNPLKAIQAATKKLTGSYALVLMFADQPHEIWTTRKDSPMILGKGADGCYIASDVPALLDHTRDVYYIDNYEIARLNTSEIVVFRDEKTPDSTPCGESPNFTHIDWDVSSAQKAGFDHFMLKEIFEQPQAIEDTVRAYIEDDGQDARDAHGARDTSTHYNVNFHHALSEEMLSCVSRIHIVACGSAFHVGMVAKYVIEEMSRVPVLVDVASEFRYRNPILLPRDMVIIISQSGETADSLAALRQAKEQGVPTLAIVNVVGSSIAREADYVLYTLAGPEIAVATTKAFSAQLALLYVVAIQLAHLKHKLDDVQVDEYVRALLDIPQSISLMLGNQEKIRKLAQEYATKQSIFFIGRGLDFGASMEASLKLKEISYIHSEAYAAGELKHGTISLIEDGVCVMGILTQPQLFEKMRSNLVEVKSRGAHVSVVSYEGAEGLDGIADDVIYIPHTLPLFATSLMIVPLQLLAYYVSCEKGLDVDKPRNLAKSVTVE